MLNLNFPIFITLLVLVPVLGYNANSTYLPDNSTNCTFNSSFITEKVADSHKIYYAIDTLFFFIMFNIFGWKYLFIDFIIS